MCLLLLRHHRHFTSNAIVVAVSEGIVGDTDPSDHSHSGVEDGRETSLGRCATTIAVRSEEGAFGVSLVGEPRHGWLGIGSLLVVHIVVEQHRSRGAPTVPKE